MRSDTLGPSVGVIEPVLIGRVDFARMMGIGASTFDRHRAAGLIGPAPVSVGGAVRWHVDEVRAWLATRTGSGELHDSTTWPAVWKHLQTQSGYAGRASAGKI